MEVAKAKAFSDQAKLQAEERIEAEKREADKNEKKLKESLDIARSKRQEEHEKIKDMNRQWEEAMGEADRARYGRKQAESNVNKLSDRMKELRNREQRAQMETKKMRTRASEIRENERSLRQRNEGMADTMTTSTHLFTRLKADALRLKTIRSRTSKQVC